MKGLNTKYSFQSFREKRMARGAMLRRCCNLCRQTYQPEFRFQRFCRKCRSHNDSFLFHEWLPQLPEAWTVA